MSKKALYVLLSIVFLSTACSIDDQEIEDNDEIVNTPFTEGIVEMGMFSHGIDIGHYIDHIDFSRNDTQEQLESLIAELGPENDLMSHFQAIGERNPMAAFVLMINTVISDYYIKDETVFGKSRGFGFVYDHFHDKGSDVGKIYMHTLASTPEIPEADRTLYVEYSPSEQAGTNPNSSFDVDLFDRQQLDRKENILGYACDVTRYTPKAGFTPPPADPANPIAGPMIHQLVVYTSPLFSNTINFTHPFYMPEEGGILRVDIFLENSDQPTLEMRPYQITPQVISEAQLGIESTEPVYQITDFSWGWKSLAIFMSGWATFGE